MVAAAAGKRRRQRRRERSGGRSSHSNRICFILSGSTSIIRRNVFTMHGHRVRKARLSCLQCTTIVFAMHGYRVRNAPLSLPGNDMYMRACMWFPVASGRSLFCVLPLPWPITTACLCVCRHGGGQGGKKGGGRGVNERGNEGKSERECVCMCVCARVNG